MSDQPRIAWWRRWTWQSWTLSVIAALFVVWFLAWGPVGLMEIPARPEFCATCHNMQIEYDSWRVSVHSSQVCGDCHLPVEFFSRTAWDAFFGMRDFYKFHVVGEWDEPIVGQPHTVRFVQENCIRCHGYTAHAAISEDRQCWDCHREMLHRHQLWKDEQAQRRIDDPRD